MDSFEKFVKSLSGRFNWLACGAVVAMMLLTCADVIGRSFRQPVPGTYEIVSLLGLIIVGFAIAQAQVERAHVAMEFVVSRLGQRVCAVFASVTTLLSLSLFIVLGWQLRRYATLLWHTGEVSPTQQIPFYPLVYAVALALLPMCLVLLVEFIRALAQVVKK